MPSDLTTGTFLGCSVRSFNLSIGRDDTSSVLNVDLVEDLRKFERFNGKIGSLVKFDYQGWIFYGVLSNMNETKDSGGNRLYSVVLTDGRELLSGVILILQGYNGFTYSVPNLYNIYGYLETVGGFGYSGANSFGIPWKNVRDTFLYLNSITPIYLGNTPFFVDLSFLPQLPNYYRISANSVSLLDFVREICEMANHDFTVLLNGNIIQFICFNRNIIYTTGAITRFLQSIGTGFVSLESGIVLEYNTTNKFLVGPQVEQIYFQYNTNFGTGPTYDDTISKYWGLDRFGNVILSNRGIVSDVNQHNSNDYFYVNGDPISIDLNRWYTYPMDTEELRAAAEGRSEWEWHICLHKNNKQSIHLDKARKLGLDSDIVNNLLLKLSLKSLDQIGIIDVINKDRLEDISDFHEAYLDRVYRFVYNYATEYHGRKFMVRIPFVYAKVETDGQIDSGLVPIQTTLAPLQEGYIEESLYATAVNQGIMPEYTDFVTTPEGKITAYARFGPFNSFHSIDLSNLSEDQYYVSGPYIFVRCDVDPKIVFLNRATAFSPRVVITLPAPIYYTDEREDLSLLETAYVNEQIKLVPLVNGIRPPVLVAEARDLAKKEWNVWKKQVGAEYAFMKYEKVCLTPNMVAVPLQDTRTTYGPWYSTGGKGKVEFEQNFEMAPWNFGGFANMNLAGRAMVDSANSVTMIGEGGSVEVPGVPTLQPAQQLIAAGPLVTDIQVSVGEDGVTSTYRMGKWNNNYGQQIQYNIEQAKKIYALKREQARAFRTFYKPKPPLDPATIRFGLRSFPPPRRLSSKTSHGLIMCSLYDRDGKQGNNIAFMPYYHLSNVMDGDWNKLAGASLDSLFRPYSTSYTASGIPHFQDPSGYTGGDPTVEDLNPFKVGHDIHLAIRGTTPSGTDIVYGSGTGYGPEDEYRGIAFKGPIVIAGWGYDTNGVLVPSGEYLTEQERWKVGPLDTKWDDERGVWVAGGTGAKLYLYTLYTNMGAGHGSGTIYEMDGTSLNISGRVVNTLGMATGKIIGGRGVATKYNDYWYHLTGPCE